MRLSPLKIALCSLLLAGLFFSKELQAEASSCLEGLQMCEEVMKAFDNKIVENIHTYTIGDKISNTLPPKIAATPAALFLLWAMERDGLSETFFMAPIDYTKFVSMDSDVRDFIIDQRDGILRLSDFSGDIAKMTLSYYRIPGKYAEDLEEWFKIKGGDIFSIPFDLESYKIVRRGLDRIYGQGFGEQNLKRMPLYQRKFKAFESVVLDDIDLHLESEYFPEKSAIENAITPMAFFILWCMENDALSEKFPVGRSEYDEFINMKRDLRRFLLEVADGRINSDFLNKDIAKFAIDYYKNGRYFRDIISWLGLDSDELYAENYSPSSYNLIRGGLNERFAAWMTSESR